MFTRGQFVDWIWSQNSLDVRQGVFVVLLVDLGQKLSETALCEDDEGLV